MKALRYIIFVPLIFLIIGTVYTLLPISLFYLMSLSRFWLIFLLIFFGGLAVSTYQFLPGGMSWLTAKICPNKTFAFYSILITSIILAIVKIHSYWTTQNFQESGFGIFLGIMLTCLTIGFAFSFSIGGGIEIFEEKVASLVTLMSIGAMFFYIGMFLAFCLLSTTICYISPDKTYTWYSGIWHGIFVIPNWVVTWFSAETYCKAPNSTTAYSIWWWVSFIFVGLGILGGGKRK